MIGEVYEVFDNGSVIATHFPSGESDDGGAHGLRDALKVAYESAEDFQFDLSVIGLGDGLPAVS